jgi:hypothetical protein
MSHHTHFHLKDDVAQHNPDLHAAKEKSYAETAQQGYVMESNTAENAAIKNFLPKCSQVIGALSEGTRRVSTKIEAYTHVLRDLHNTQTLKNVAI